MSNLDSVGRGALHATAEDVLASRAAWSITQGDCLEFIPTESLDAVITDPPYGIDYQSAWRTGSRRHAKIANDKQPFVWWLFDAARVVKPGGCLLCFCRWDVAEAFRLAIGWSGLHVGAQLVWDRELHGLGDLTGRPAPQHDLIWFAVKGTYSLPGKRPTSVYRHGRLAGADLQHPNQKPLDLMCDLVTDFVPMGGGVLDCFLGSGTTGVACVRTGRRFVGCEIQASHFATARQRIESASCDGPMFTTQATLFGEVSS